MLVYALNDVARLDLLAELSSGEPRMVKDLAKRIGKTPGSTSKHLIALTKAGIVKNHNRCYQLAEHYRPAPGTREIDLGQCVLRLER